MSDAPLDLSDFLDEFIAEFRERLDEIAQGLIALEQEPFNRTLLRDLMRAAHTIKGGAKMMGLETIAQLAHRIEDVFEALVQGQREMSSALNDHLLVSIDLLGQMALTSGTLAPPEQAHLDELDATLARFVEQGIIEAPVRAPVTAARPVPLAAASSSPSTTPTAPPTADQPPPAESELPRTDTIRIATELLDALMNRVRELMVIQQGIEAHRQALSLVQGQARRSLDRHEHAGFLNAISRMAQQLDEHADRLERVVGELQSDVVHARMVPLSTVTGSMMRALREQARARGKQVTFIVQGETTPLDKQIVERLREPLIHLLRNSVDHGIEPPAARLASGKAPEGTVRLIARPTVEGVELRLEDDGAGIDLGRLRQRAVSAGLMTEQMAAGLTDEDAQALVFHDGISTSSELTDTSGRGVGMAVVRRTIEAMRGRLRMQSRPGEGTTFTITLPLTLATLRVVVVAVGDEIFAIPADQVAYLRYASAADLVRDKQGQIIRLPDEQSGELRPVPILSLSQLLGVAPPASNGSEPPPRQALVILDADTRLALSVDRLVDEAETVVQPVGALLRQATLVRGAVTLSDGRLAVLLDGLALAEAARAPRLPAPVRTEKAPAKAAPQRRAPRVLVVDDALTPRELVRSILTAAGYEVTTARDGMEALGLLQTHRFDATVSDVDMPRLTGFELVEAMRLDPTLAQVPVVLITSRDSAEDRQRGLQAGAQAYIVKGTFNQENLLDVLGRLIGE